MTRKPRSIRLTAMERRAIILAAAEKVLAASGYGNTSMAQIATASGVSKPVLYDHFPSKAALLVGVLEAIRADLLARGRHAVATGDTPQQQMRAGVDSFFSFVEERPTAAHVMFVVGRSEPEAVEISNRIQRDVTVSLSRLLGAILPQEKAWKRSATAEFLKRGLHALAEWWLSNPKVRREDLVEAVMRVIWTGLSSQVASVGRIRNKR